ncbi:hypothetical protein M9H77_07529 [Catharanthus roseus]|uniref:Uncharacterized protein n=1 Tax=Catharanthus roseus TaxID=4058 RepID=A0ACC0BV72_CATRO|nr:hypothetical protein M9H77_07529 [Catharanthus roseus]
MMGRDFRVGYESYEGSRYFYMDDGVGIHLNKKLGIKENLWAIGISSNEHIGKKTSISEPSDPWSKKSEIEESARSLEVMLDKNDTCEGKESHERIERVEESEGISGEHCFLDAIPSLFEKVERDESEIQEERKDGTIKEKESLFEENERINEEKESGSAKERHGKSSYSLELKLDSLLSEEICLLFNQFNPFLTLISSYVQNFQDKRKRIGGKLHDNHKETLISFYSNSLPLSIEFSFKELKLFLNAHVSHEDVFGKLFKESLSYYPIQVSLGHNSLLGATRDHSCDNPLYDSRMNDYYSYAANVDSFVLRVENKKECMLGVF